MQRDPLSIILEIIIAICLSILIFGFIIWCLLTVVMFVN